MRVRERAIWMMSLLVVAGAIGCKTDKLAVEEGITIKVKLLKGGQPLSAPGANVPGMELIQAFQISLVPQGGSEGHARGAYLGTYAADGTVTFVGPGKGIPPGIYRLTVISANAMPDAEDQNSDPFQGRFTLEKTPFEFTITVADMGKEKDLGTIDLDKPPGK